MKKRLIIIYVYTVLALILIGWQVGAYLDTFVQVNQIVKENPEEWFFYMNIAPLIWLGLLTIILYIYLSYDNKKKGLKKRGRFLRRTFLPEELVENDEREQMITGRACRNAYIAMWVAMPFLAISLAFYPFVQSFLPYFPIIVFMCLPLTMITTFHVTIWRRI